MADLPEQTDLLVIGGGPGGYAAAFEGARQGLDVTLVNNEDVLGGVCLRRGCIPSKTLLHLNELVHAAQAASDAGLLFAAPEVELDTIRQHKNAVIDQLTGGIGQLARHRHVRVIRARARFADNSHVELDGETQGTLAFDHAVIATGSRPQALPDIDFGGRIMSSTEALELPEVPDSLLVIGGGYIGLELGMAYQALGSRVTLAEMTERLMPGADADLVKPLADAADKHFDTIHLNTKASGIEAGDDDVRVQLDTADEQLDQRFGRVLIAIGRQPNTADLNLAATDVACDDAGFVQVDESRSTTAAGILAIGDAAGGMLLAHEAMHEGKVAARVAAGQAAAFDARAVPAVVFTDPQLAWCGLTEEDARNQNLDVQVQRFPWQAAGRAVTMGATAGLTKIIADADSGRVLGAGIVGPQAEALIAEAVLAIEMGAVAEDLAATIHAHPTLSETVGEGAELFSGQATHYG